MLNIKINEDGGKLDLALEGRLDTTTSRDLEEVLNDRYENVSEIGFDLADMTYISSAGLRVLLAAQKQMNEKDGRMTVCHVSDDVMEIFEMTGFSEIMEIL